MKCIKILILAALLLYIFPTPCFSQIKTNWTIIELVSNEGKSLKKWNANSSISFIDSILVVSCDDSKVLGLLSNPKQGFFDDSKYRVFKLAEPIQSIKDSIGIIYRRSYTSPFYFNNIVMMVDDSLSFIMMHPNVHIGLVFHNKKDN
jgi:hypothetical protein|tara:strand:+ start:2687 stop:3127 length:441 start_codon:yes stop_codon:yes gene_type:complete